MSDFAPPTGPPPPKVPEGWKAVWNAQYSEWFFVNIYTKKSQWDKPTEPIYPPGEAPPDGPPPYNGPPGAEPRKSTEKQGLGSNNPYAAGGPSPNANVNEDEAFARRLQEEENARAHGAPSGDQRGAADAYYGQGSTPQPGGYGGYGQQSSSPYPQAQSPYADPAAAGTQDKGKSKGGLLGKLLGKHGSSSQQPQGYPQQHYAQPGYGQPQGYYGGQQGYYQPQQAYGKPPKKGGLGAGGAAALGVGGGLLGGALLGEALGDAGDGGNYGGDGGDYGGDGGDFGGDGGGDFGGGDF